MHDVVYTFQMPYNMERVLWIYSGGNAELCNEIMGPFAKSGEARIPQDLLDKVNNVDNLIMHIRVVKKN